MNTFAWHIWICTHAETFFMQLSTISTTMTLCDLKNGVLLQVKSLTSTSRSLAPPAPHPICQALDVGRPNAVVSRVAGEYYFGAILIVWTIDYPPFPMVQRERAETGTHHDCAKKGRAKKRERRGDSVGSGHCFFRIIQMEWLLFQFLLLSLIHTLLSQNL